MLDQATQDLLRRSPTLWAAPWHEMTPAAARALVAERPAQPRAPEGSEPVEVRQARVAVTGGDLDLCLLIPPRRIDGVIVYYPGGGWVLDPMRDAEGTGRALAQRSGCAVILVEHRSAPEYRFPTAVHDAHAALRWVASRVPALAGRPVPLIVAGDGTGGNLSAVMAQHARASGAPSIALQLLICPVTDCDFETGSYRDPRNQATLSRDTMIWCWDHYAPVADARRHPDASPLRAPTLAGLAPAIVITAEHDVLRDEGELYATLMLKAGVPVSHRRFDGQAHGFFGLGGYDPGGAEAMDHVAELIAQALAGADDRRAASTGARAERIS